MPFPWCFMDSMTAPELTLRACSCAAASVTLLVNTRLDSFRRVCVRLREASARAGFSMLEGSPLRALGALLGPGWGED